MSFWTIPLPGLMQRKVDRSVEIILTAGIDSFTGFIGFDGDPFVGSPYGSISRQPISGMTMTSFSYSTSSGGFVQFQFLGDVRSTINGARLIFNGTPYNLSGPNYISQFFGVKSDFIFSPPPFTMSNGMNYTIKFEDLQ